MNIQQILEECLLEWREISGLEFALLDEENQPFVRTCERALPAANRLLGFRDSEALCMANSSCALHKVIEKKRLCYLLVVWGEQEKTVVMGQLAVCQVRSLLTAYAEKNDKHLFFQKLLSGQYTEGEIYSRMKKLHLPVQSRRVVFLLETRQERDLAALSLVRNLCAARSGDYEADMGPRLIAVIHELSPHETADMLEEYAQMLVTMLNTEAMTSAMVSYSGITEHIRDLENAFREAMTALEIGEIFFAEQRVFGYDRLGIGRLIYQLPMPICELFLKEVFEDPHVLEELDEETLITIRTFFENNLNLSETSRNLYVHRNTLMYRFEKLQKKLGLDVRTFEGALTFRIAMMVSDYIRHSRKENRSLERGGEGKEWK